MFDSLPSKVIELVAISALSGPVILNIWAYNCCVKVFDWIALPVKNEQIIAKQAKVTANHLHWGPSPFSIVYIGPPAVLPSESVSLYSKARVHSAYFNAVPKKAVIHIQNNAPGPP